MKHRRLSTKLATIALIGVCPVGVAAAADYDTPGLNTFGEPALEATGSLRLAQAGQETPATEARTFDIAPQALSTALTEFGRQSGLQIAVDTNLVADLRSPGVDGTYTPEEALQLLLSGTGLRSRMIAANSVTLEPLPADNLQVPRQLAPVTVTAARGVERPISAIPGGVQIIDRQQIEDLVPNDVGDTARALDRIIPGANFEETLDRSNLILRGRRVQIQLGGVPIDQKFEDLGRELDVIEPDLLESIEVVRSANAANGVGAPGGVINLIPRRPKPGEFSLESSAGISMSPADPGRSFTPFMLQSVSLGEEKYDFIGSVKWERRKFRIDGEDDVIPVRGVGSTASNIVSATTRLGVNMTETQRAEFGSTVHYYKQHEPFFVPVNGVRGVTKPTPVQAEARGIGQFALGTDPATVDPVDNLNVTLDLDYTHQEVFGGTLTSKTYYQRNDFTIFGTRNDIDKKVGQRVAFDYQPPFWWLSNVAVGVDAEYSDYSSEDTRTGVDLNPKADQWRYGAFVQVDVTLGDLLLTGGVRGERIEQEVGPFASANPADRLDEKEEANFDAGVFNVGAVYFVTDELELFAGFSQGYDVPQISDAAGRVDNSVVDFSDTEFEPVETDSYEVGFRYFGERLSGSVTGYFNESDLDVVIDCPNPGAVRCLLLRQPSEFWGVEMTGEYRAADYLTVGAVAAYNDGIIEEDGDARRATAIDVTPPSFTVYADGQVREWWRMRGDLRFVDKLDGRRASFLPTFDEYVVVDLLSEFTLPMGELTIGVANLFDEFYIPARRQAFAAGFLQIPAPGRTVSLAYSYKW